MQRHAPICASNIAFWLAGPARARAFITAIHSTIWMHHVLQFAPLRPSLASRALQEVCLSAAPVVPAAGFPHLSAAGSMPQTAPSLSVGVVWMGCDVPEGFAELQGSPPLESRGSCISASMAPPLPSRAACLRRAPSALLLKMEKPTLGMVAEDFALNEGLPPHKLGTLPVRASRKTRRCGLLASRLPVGGSNAAGRWRAMAAHPCRPAPAQRHRWPLKRCSVGSSMALRPSERGVLPAKHSQPNISHLCCAAAQEDAAAAGHRA